MIEKPIFILGVHKSGTTLLRSLLEGHPALFAIPIETHVFKFNGYWVDYPYRRNFPKKTSIEMVKKKYHDWINNTNDLPSNFKGGEVPTNWDIDLFQEYLDKKGKFENIKNSIESYFLAIAHSLGADPNKRFVEKSVENAEFGAELEKIFPDAKFVHIIRNPYANIVSLRKFSIGYHYPFIKPIYEALYNNYYFLYKNRNNIQNYKIIRYEDLVENPEYQMDNLADFLDISRSEKLYKPTNNGEIWQGNSNDNEKYQSVSTSRLGKWKKEITPMECKIVNDKFPFILKDFNYDSFEMKSYWKKNKNETLKNYLKNRLFIRNI